jgi:uncharacterized protein (DUF983 family)
MNNKKPNRFLSMLGMKCPNCHKGNMYTNKSIFPLGKLLDMPERCPVCGQKYEIELGFWYGTGYVSYALSVATIGILAILYALIVGFSWYHDYFYDSITTIDHAIFKSIVSLCICKIW